MGADHKALPHQPDNDDDDNDNDDFDDDNDNDFDDDHLALLNQLLNRPPKPDQLVPGLFLTLNHHCHPHSHRNICHKKIK